MSMGGVGVVLPEVQDAGLVSKRTGAHFQILILYPRVRLF